MISMSQNLRGERMNIKSPVKLFRHISLVTISLLIISGCNKGQKGQDAQAGGTMKAPLIRYTYKLNEITQICDGEIRKTDDRIKDFLKIDDKEKNFHNTLEAFEQITADLSENTTAATFMNYVSLDKNSRSEAEKCEAKIGQYAVGLMTRRDIYDAIVKSVAQTPTKNLSPEEHRLVEQTMKGFKANGLFLPDDKLKELKELKQKLSSLETEFASNLNEVTDFQELTKAELEGVPESMVRRLEKLPNGNYKVTTKPTDYVQFMENAKSSEARRRMASKYENMASEKNTKLLQEAILLRKKISALLGFKNWADYRIENNMAKDSKTVMEFLNSLRKKLSIRNAQDSAKFLKFKKELDPTADHLDAWDFRYLDTQLKKRDYAVDDEVIREYFPAEQVVARMFEVYSKILSVKFVEVPNAATWAPGVKLYEIHDATKGSNGKFIANFFTDFYPRDGKYNHFAAFTLVSGRMVDGKYRTPVSSIVGNFNPPSAGVPALLSHDEVETLFHEFGHIMHQTLTTAKYASLAGSSVARDFVEAPSQMLENWVWDPMILKMISGSYKDPKKKLPDTIIKKLIASRDFDYGYVYTRQLLFGLFDMQLHTSDGTINATETYKKLYKELTGVDPLPESHFPAGFGHLMGGYDAGYYGYLWSKVFAEDMFTRFENDGLLSSEVGMDYRRDILEKGDTMPADKLLIKFLGRKPNNKAFFKRLGLM
jgi:thimet oligopeptidase